MKLGERVFRSIHGPTAATQLEMLHSLPGVFVEGILGEAYGRVIAREVFDLALRELVAMACLTVLELPRVLRAHSLAALRHGASLAEAAAVVERAAVLTHRPAEPALGCVREAARSLSGSSRSSEGTA